MSKYIISIDPGLTGALALFEAQGDSYRLVGTTTIGPISRCIQPATYKYKYSDPKKVLKSGPNKGHRPKVIRTKAKYKNKFNAVAWAELIAKLPRDAYVVIEDTFSMTNHHAKATYTNQGIIQGILLSKYGEIPTLVSPSFWKKKMNLTDDKQVSLNKAKALHPYKYPSHDCAEAVLIGVFAYTYLT